MKKKTLIAYLLTVSLSASLLFGCGGGSNTETKELATTTAVTETEKVTEAPITDMELVMSHYRARYYDPFEHAEQMKDQAMEGTVVTPDSGKYSSKTILLFDGYDDQIKNIEIYFKNFSEPVDVSLNQAVEVAYHYLPSAIIDICYELNDTYILKPFSGGESYYIIEYSLNTTTEQSTYVGLIDVVFNVSGDSVNYLTISFRTPRWMTTSSDEYDTIEWDLDTSKYME